MAEKTRNGPDFTACVVVCGRLLVRLANHVGAVLVTLEAVIIRHDLNHGLTRFIFTKTQHPDCQT